MGKRHRFTLILGFISVLLVVGTTQGLSSLQKNQTENCVQIFYDHGDKKFSKELKSLLTSFVSVPTKLHAVENYSASDFEKCQLNFYIGSLYDNKIPRALLDDYIMTEQKVVWIGYNIWQLGELFEKHMGLRFLRMAHSDGHWGKSTEFFKDILYKGQTFSKVLDSEQIELVPTDLHKFESVAEIRHSRTREVIPYIVRSKNKFYIADNPLSGLPNKDASFVLTNVLTEILGLQHFPRPQYGIR